MSTVDDDQIHALLDEIPREETQSVGQDSDDYLFQIRRWLTTTFSQDLLATTSTCELRFLILRWWLIVIFGHKQ